MKDYKKYVIDCYSMLTQDAGTIIANDLFSVQRLYDCQKSHEYWAVSVKGKTIGRADIPSHAYFLMSGYVSALMDMEN